MSTPHPDDSWAELYNELGLEPETPAPKAAEPEAELYVESTEESEEYADSAEADSDTESESESESDSDGEGETAEGETSEDGGEPGKKKRRRRRRRRGGKKDDAEGGAEGEESDTATAVLEDVDGPGPEAAQQLIANWDVPSWGEIVAGLYRPSGSGR